MELTLSPTEIEELRKLQRNLQGRLDYARVTCILMLSMGNTPIFVADCLGIDISTTYRYRSLYLEGGLDKLLENRYKGYQGLLNIFQIESLKQELRTHLYTDAKQVSEWVKDTFEVVSENNVKIYSLYDIQNVKIAEGQYKSRVEQTPFSSSTSLSVDYSAECGNVTYNTLALIVQPKEADNIDGEVVIKYTTNGQEHSVTMPIKDLKKRSLNDNFYILKQKMFRLNEDNGDLGQQVNVNNTMDRPVMIGSSNITIKAYTEKPEVFDTLNSANFGEGPNAIIKFGSKKKIPVKVMMTFYTKIVDLSDGQYAGVLELEDDKLYLHYTKDSGKLYERYLIAKTEYASKTDSDIVANFVAYNGATLIIKNDGSTITDEELRALDV